METGIGGYNGLPTVMSGLDESMSDVVPRKKYPFELEKALHNVMFIQHHIQRQDEFNAVSIKTIKNPNNRKINIYTFFKLRLETVFDELLQIILEIFVAKKCEDDLFFFFLFYYLMKKFI